MIEGINAALGGLNRAATKLNASSQELANGNLDTEPIVNSKLAQREAEAQIATIQTINEVEDSALDILA
ncbi:hypothetical protein [Acanthopleuribacter pedis]|uniref:Uncharacterized protein n=1 Tax=Acanthopleuribacter pedis TaxID=442870 RepID=A0A8J7U2Y0_9BACT|nr:hypothetical protein [Acanthopleuribacter pedis]MBO1317758.1 hypothetical protein [Acanthopleuribacter pedis]